MAVEIYLPKMSDHMGEGTILRWLVKEGEPVEQGQVILEIETDKAVGEIEAPIKGILKGITASEGETVPVGETIAYITQLDEKTPLPESQANGQEEGTVQKYGIFQQDLIKPDRESSGSNKITPATPVARRIARELGVDISKVTGTGPGGRVKEEDVRAYARAYSDPTLAPAATFTEAGESHVSTDPSQFTGEKLVPLTQLQKITGERMLESVHQAPHFSLRVTANMAECQRLIEKARQHSEANTGTELSVTVLLVKAAALALQKHPRANSIFEGGSLRLFSEINIGVAIGSEDGLVVPVIKSAADKSLESIAQELKGFQAKAKEMRFNLEELSGGTFTISNLGMYGVDDFTAIINPPQCAILAVGRIAPTPVGRDDGSIILHPLISLTLSIDHRCMDGLQGAKFLAEVKKQLEQPCF